MKSILKLMKQTRKNRMRITNICLNSNTLFQVPFSFDHIKRYKGISCYNTYDCLFQVLTVLGLRHYSISKRDSRKIHKDKSNGVEVHVVAKHLSSIFGTNIETEEIDPYYQTSSSMKLKWKEQQQIHKSLISHMTLENGHATFVCGVLYNTIQKTESGHFFIVHKQNDKLYYYDQSSGKHTTNINNFFTNKKLLSFFAYHNMNNSTSCLIKEKINEEVPLTYNERKD